MIKTDQPGFDWSRCKYLMRVSEITRLTGISRHELRRLEDDGVIKCVSILGGKRFRTIDVFNLCQGMAQGGKVEAVEGAAPGPVTAKELSF